MAENELVQVLNQKIGIDLPGNIDTDELHAALRGVINDLIQHDFQRLVSVLYRVDIEENKLKKILKEQQGTDAAEIITSLIIERERQKIETRKKFRK